MELLLTAYLSIKNAKKEKGIREKEGLFATGEKLLRTASESGVGLAAPQVGLLIKLFVLIVMLILK
jgi:peptide deformylase